MTRKEYYGKQFQILNYITLVPTTESFSSRWVLTNCIFSAFSTHQEVNYCE